MSVREAPCPACGAPLEFRNAATLYVVCPYCGGAASRTGQDLEKIGKVAEVVPIDSPFELKMRAALKGKAYTVVGQIQLDHGSGPWNEWCLAFDDGKWGWLAEAQGHYLYSKEIPVPSSAPPWGTGKPGNVVHLGGAGDFTVNEVGEATVVAALGELPVRVDPGSAVRYLDMQGEGRAIATLDYGDGDLALAAYAGRSVDIDDLGLPPEALERERVMRVEAARISCPNCAGQVDLQHPKEALRATCKSCGSLLDPRKGHLKALGKAWDIEAKPVIPLGSKGTLRGHEVEVLAFLVRSVRAEGIRYPWEEYLLRIKGGGYRWLTRSDNHWSFVEPLSLGEINKRGLKVIRAGKTYKHFQGGDARVDHVQGEVYWEVAVGEKATSNDYVAPPEMVSIEETKNEKNATLCTYIEQWDVKEAFGLKHLALPSGVAPNQPNPHVGSRGPWWKAYGALAIATIILMFAFHLRAANHTVYKKSLVAKKAVAGATAPPKAGEEIPGRVIFSPDFTLDDKSNLRLELHANVSNDWMGLDGALVNLKTGEVRGFTLLAQYYHGRSGGESWSEGSRDATTWLGGLPAGEYALRMEPATAGGAGEIGFSIEARAQDASEGRPILLLFLLTMGPMIPTMAYFMFESRRWAQSDHAAS